MSMKNQNTFLPRLIGAAALCLAALQTAQAEVDPALVKRGEYLARVGDCVACHSAPGKPAFSGGLAIDSGHGVIYSTNITPDKQHGIGNYTEQQFADAMRKGLRADGTHLYPAMPYPNYAKVSDADTHALYAYFMNGVKPSSAVPPATNMAFPFNLRWGMSLWNFLFLSGKSFQPQPDWNEQVKLGAYLVEGLGHCSSCHTPRGFAMNEKASGSADTAFLAGGELNGWPTPSLRGMPRWNSQDIVDYLQTGRNRSAAVAGEMTQVVQHSTAYLQDPDLQAIAAYLKALPPGPDKAAGVTPQGKAETIQKLTAAKDLSLGERLYLDNCAACHFVTGQGATRIFPQLDGATVINAKNPHGLIQVILAGARTPSTDKAPSVLVMPSFAQRLSDSELATLATFLRQGWGNRASAVSEREVAAVRAKGLAAR
ncbi:cytochrome c [Ideonella azotifigens]|uniref:Cytochrome c n=2 Tax=Ideonella azotifigens TaxID=513160 RepID=A0ABP3VQ48_9BURK|nr:cytochrome c [Ideonella azotifigens]MCD2340647.1 cytochrome c [Ideonella azotifigens]